VTLLNISFGRPLHMLVAEPLVWPTALRVGVSQAVVFCFYVAFPLIFQEIYDFTAYQVGLVFLPLFVGSALGLPIVSYFDRVKYQREKELAKQERRPISLEERLYPAIVGSILMPISLFWYIFLVQHPVPC
jgi:hypothetical protein